MEDDRDEDEDDDNAELDRERGYRQVTSQFLLTLRR